MSSTASVFPCSYDATWSEGGVASYLVKRMALSIQGNELDSPERIHRSLGNDVSMLVGLYNQNFESRNEPNSFLAMVEDAGLLELPDSSTTCFVPHEIKKEIFDRYKDSNDRLVSELFIESEGFNDRDVDERALYEPDYLKLISYLLLIIYKHQQRIENQNSRLHELKHALNMRSIKNWLLPWAK